MERDLSSPCSHCRLLPLEPAHSPSSLCLVISRVDDVTKIDYSLVAPLTIESEFVEGQLKVRLPWRPASVCTPEPWKPTSSCLCCPAPHSPASPALAMLHLYPCDSRNSLCLPSPRAFALALPSAQVGARPSLLPSSSCSNRPS